MQLGGVGTDRYSGRIYRSMTDGRASNCDRPPCSLPHKRQRISVSQPAAYTTTTKRREQSRLVRSGKSEAEPHSLTHSLTGTLDRPRVIAPSKEPALDQCIILLKLLTDTKHRAAFLRQQDWSNGPFLSFARYQTYL